MSTLPNFDFGHGETIDMLRDTVQRFAAAEIAPIAEEVDRSNVFPRQLWPKLGELGLLGMTVEPEFGGSGLGLSICTGLLDLMGSRVEVSSVVGEGSVFSFELELRTVALASAASVPRPGLLPSCRQTILESLPSAATARLDSKSSTSLSGSHRR